MGYTMDMMHVRTGGQSSSARVLSYIPKHRWRGMGANLTSMPGLEPGIFCFVVGRRLFYHHTHGHFLDIMESWRGYVVELILRHLKISKSDAGQCAVLTRSLLGISLRWSPPEHAIPSTDGATCSCRWWRYGRCGSAIHRAIITMITTNLLGQS